MITIEELLAKAHRENREAEEKSRAPTKVEVEKEALFLRGWAKGRPIVRLSSGATFWTAGKWTTKLTYKMVQAIADAGLGKLQGDPKEGGAKLIINKK